MEKVAEVFYAEPDSPLLVPEESKSDVRYAEPDTCGKLPSTYYAELNEPEKNKYPEKGQDGYAEPIDVLKTANTFPNPVYEEVYADPYQGVSGTSLYANPNETLDFRLRKESFIEFPRHKLQFQEKIGDGQFGEVHIGEAEGVDKLLGKEFKKCQRMTVAIKKLKPNVDENIKENFFKEVKIMANLRHENVVRLLGVCKDDPMCMIVEYMVNGDLNQFLRDCEFAPGLHAKGHLLSLQVQLYMALQLAAGMKYISSLNFVHRDLATRNLLVGHAYTIKIADFGMSRNLYCKHYYRIHGRAVLPVRWMAPECILQGKHSICHPCVGLKRDTGRTFCWSSPLVGLTSRLRLPCMPDRFLGRCENYLVQCKHDWTASERLCPENLSDRGRTTFKSGARALRR